MRCAAFIRSDDDGCNGGILQAMALEPIFGGIFLALAQLELWCEGIVATGRVRGETATAIATFELPCDCKQVIAALAHCETGEYEAFGNFDGTSGGALLDLPPRIPNRVEGVVAEVRHASE